MGKLVPKKTIISRTLLKRSHSPNPRHIPKSQQKSVVTEKVNLKKNKTVAADALEIIKMNCSSLAQISVEVITKKNKEPLEYISTEAVKMHSASSQSQRRMIITKKFQSDKKEKHEDISEILKKNRKSNRERKVNQLDCYEYY